MNCYSPVDPRFERHAVSRHAIVRGIAIVAFLLFAPSRSHADLIINAGWDLFTTTSDTMFAGQSFTGVRLGTFDFGGSIGVHGVGNADTIVHRLSSASVPGPVPPSATANPISIEMVVLQLVSVNPIDLGAGLDFHYITLQSARGGPSTTGEMTITFDSDNGGTFDSFFDVFFDVRLGSLNGQIIFSDSMRLSSNDVMWDRIPPPLAVEINGVNRFLNGVNRDNDFWAVTPFVEEHPSGAKHVVQMASVPEPSGLAVFGVGAILLTARRAGCGRKQGGRPGTASTGAGRI